MRVRLEEFALSLHPDKTRLIDRSSPASMVTMQCRPTSRHLRPSVSMSLDSGGARFGGAVKKWDWEWDWD
jgi:hypothetical protein